MRAAVLEQAREMGFAASAVARSLSRRRSNTIGVYAGSYFNAKSGFAADVISGLQEACDAHRLDLLLHGTFPGRSADEICDEFHSGKIDGLAVIHLDAEFAKKLAGARIPVVSLVNRVAGIPTVVADEHSIGELMARYLLERGHRRFLYRARVWSDATRRRFAAFSATIEAAGAQLTVEEVPILGVTPREIELLHGPTAERPSAVVGWEDEAAYEMLEWCRSRGLRVPDDIAIVGLNGVERRGSGPRLTTVDVPYREIAQTAVELILNRLAGASIAPVTTLPVAHREGETA